MCGEGSCCDNAEKADHSAVLAGAPAINSRTTGALDSKLSTKQVGL